MKIEDLRIGNIVIDFRGAESVVIGINKGGLVRTLVNKCSIELTESQHVDTLMGVGLSDEIFLKLGFEDKTNCFNFSRREDLGHEFGDFAISKYDDTQIKIWRGDRYCGIVHCQFVHELQNLFFILTGIELLLTPEL